MNTSYCVNCGETFADGDRATDTPYGSMHYDCLMTEQALENI